MSSRSEQTRSGYCARVGVAARIAVHQEAGAEVLWIARDDGAELLRLRGGYGSALWRQRDGNGGRSRSHGDGSGGGLAVVGKGCGFEDYCGRRRSGSRGVVGNRSRGDSGERTAGGAGAAGAGKRPGHTLPLRIVLQSRGEGSGG